jgi:hypothetical protein
VIRADLPQPSALIHITVSGLIKRDLFVALPARIGACTMADRSGEQMFGTK